MKARDYKGPSSDGDGDGAPLIAHTLRAQAQASHRADTETYVTHSLRGEQAYALRAAAGGGSDPYVLAPLEEPTPIDMRQASRGATMTNNRPEGSSGGAPGTGIGRPGDPVPTLSGSHVAAIAFTSKDWGQDATEDLSPTMRSMAHGASHANGGGQLAVCVTGDITHTLKAEGFDGSEDGSGRGQPIVAAAMAVRRLMPVECERLQGFPDSYTLVPVGKKMAADGPRYKALGNSMAVPVMAWIGRRIQMVEEIA